MNIKGAIFDMDGTLIDSLMVWDIIWSGLGERFLKNSDFRPEEAMDKQIRTMTLKDAMYCINDIYKLSESGQEVLDETNRIIEDFYANTVKPKDGVVEFLESCYDKGIKMCIASATAIPLIEVAVRHCGIEKYFSKILSCADIGKGKECPDIYLAALEYLGTGIDETWVFEDSYVALCTAREIGVPTVGIYDKFNYGQDILKENSTIYIAENETLKKLL